MKEGQLFDADSFRLAYESEKVQPAPKDDTEHLSVLATSGSIEVEAINTAQEAEPKRVAFGRYVKPEMYDVFGDYDLSKVTEEEKAWMVTANITPILFGQGRDAVYTLNGISLNATEYGILARHPQRLVEAAGQRSLKDKDLDDEVIATSRRAEIHALEQKLAVMSDHGSKIKDQIGLVKELLSEAKKPGYAHKSPERMKELISAAWVEFVGILDVVHIQRGWDDEKRSRAETALIHHLTQGSQRDRVANWQGMIDLSLNYLNARRLLFNSRSRSTASLLQMLKNEYSSKFA